jgi:uncharacterized protein
MTSTATPPLDDQDLARLQDLLDAVPPPLQPLDLAALDGYLCGVLLQPVAVPADRWLKWVTDVDGREAPPSPALDELQALARRRHAEINRAIAQRDWFDPWIFDFEDEEEEDEDEDEGVEDESKDGSRTPTQQAVLPWVAGFAAAMDAFPALMALDEPALVEPLALLYLHFDAEDLEDAEALLAVVETIEPPADLAEAVQDIVRALMLMADVTRPRTAAPAKRPLRSGRPAQRPGPGGRRGPGR